MHRPRPRALAAASVAALLALAGCGERVDDGTAGQTPGTGAAPSGQAARSARQEARDSLASGAAAQKVGDVAPAAGDKAGDSDAGVMGAAGAVRKVDDNKITSMVIKGLKADKELNPLQIDVDTHDGVVTLSGSVPTAAARARAGEIAHSVKDVRSVNDQLTLPAG